MSGDGISDRTYIGNDNENFRLHSCLNLLTDEALKSAKLQSSTDVSYLLHF